MPRGGRGVGLGRDGLALALPHFSRNTDFPTMKKAERIAEMVAAMGISREDASHDPRYLAYFECFNSGAYYEAHDVLEDLWLETSGPDSSFYKGLIQLAGAFVHLRKQHEWPQHATHGRRLAPASRLFRLAISNLETFAPHHLGFCVQHALDLAKEADRALTASKFSRNPWNPDALPLLALANPEGVGAGHS